MKTGWIAFMVVLTAFFGGGSPVAAQEIETMTLEEALRLHRIAMEETTPTGGYSRFKIVLKNPTAEEVQIDPYGAAFQPPSGTSTQRVGIGLPLSVDGRSLNLRKPGQSSEPTNTIPPLNDDDSSTAKAVGAVAAGTLSLLGILALGQMGGQSWAQDLSALQDLLNSLSEPPPPVDGPGEPPPLNQASSVGNEPPPTWPPVTGTVNGDGKVWCQPPWDKGGPYWVDPNEYQNMKAQQSAGNIWDDRYGWVSRTEQSQYQAAHDANQLASEADSRNLANQFADNQRRLQALAEQDHQRSIADAVQKAQDQGFSNLTADDRSLLSQADENIKAMLRGDPVAIHGYEKRVAEYLMSQGAIDNTAWALGWAKDGADQSVGFIGTYGGTPGKIVGTSYTVLSNTLGSASEGIAEYNSGMSTAKTLGDAATAGAKKGAVEGIKSVVTDEAVGAITKPVAGWVSGKANNLLNQSNTLKLALYGKGIKQGLSGGLLQNAMEGELQNVNTRVKETTEWALSEGSKYIGKKVYAKYSQ